MFICTPCLKKRYENEASFSGSYGICEICNTNRLCSDIQNKSLIPLKTNRYTVTIKVVDNETTQHGDMVLHGDDPKSFANLGKAIEATCQLINLNEEELKDVQKMTQDLLTKHKT